MIYFEMTNDILIKKRENCFGYADDDLLMTLIYMPVRVYSSYKDQQNKSKERQVIN